ncbi:MAG: lipid-A-disaccharide synthase [Gemmatimonadetes bacterium]|nr:lipid-A-disaccharide synthase [Gemmatimonadota bacterium]
MGSTAPTVLISAGEVSGDEHAARVVAAAREIRPDIRFVGVAGRRMVAAGVEAIFPAEELAVVGLVEVARHLPALRRAMRKLAAELEGGGIDLCVTVDYPGFNLRLARKAARAGVPTLHYIAPKVWAWGKGRIGKVRGSIGRLAVIFNFEEKLWRDAGVDARWMGHPLLDEPAEALPRPELARLCDAERDERIVGLLPGSRDQEIRRLLRPMLMAAEELIRTRPDLRFVLPRAPGVDSVRVATEVARCRAPVIVLEGRSDAVFAHADAAIIASGTATLQAALAGIPHVLVYRVSPLTWAVGKAVVRLDHLGLPNIIAGKTIVPELLQRAATPTRIAAELGKLLDSRPERERMRGELSRVRERLGRPGAARRTAELIIEQLDRAVRRE